VTTTEGTTKVSTVLLDAGGTLVMPSFRRMAEEYAREGVVVDPLALARAEAQARLAYDQSRYARTHADPWLNFMHEIARLAEVAAPPLAAFERLRLYHDTENLWEEIIAGTEAALTDLRARYRLGVISNANGTVKRKFARLGLDHFFDVIVDSAEVGIEKPDVRIFEIALGQMKVPAAEAVYVGDVFKVDVMGARAAGMRAVLIDPNGFHPDKACDRIATLAELHPLLAGGRPQAGSM
jgi:putative hydrolase of the HAD superfamily